MKRILSIISLGELKKHEEKLLELMNLMIVDFDNLFVLAANIFESVVKLV